MIKAKRIYEPKKDDNFDIQKVLWEAIQKSINSSTDQTKTLVSEFERMSSDAGVKKLEEKFYQYIKNLRIEKEEIKQDVYKSIEDRVKNIGQRIENHDHKEYLTQEDKDECINSATDMVNEAVTRFDNLFNPFIEQLKIKANKDHSHEEFEELKKEIEENEEELEQAIEMKADKKHKHEIEDVTWLSTTLKDFAKKDHKHDEYATREELDFINRRRSGWGWAHVIQENWVVANQRGNMNFIGATVTDDPDNNATVVTVTWWGGWASSYEVTQTWHWFVDLDWLYFDETDDTYKKAQSNSVDTLWAWHVVEVVDANTFKIAKEWVHEIPNTLDLWEYVLSSTVAWWYTQTLPWDLWDWVLYGMEVISSTHISFYALAAIQVWDTWWGSGTVTSVAISGSDWLEIDSGSPVTTNGTIALGVNKTTMLSHLNVEDWAEVNNISDANATDLTDWGDTTLHTHDGRYYTESEVDTLLWGKINTSEIGTNVQAYSANLTTWAWIVPWTWVATALGINVWSAWAFVTFNWALWTPSSATLTNATGLPISWLVASTSTALWVWSIELWHASDTTLSRSSSWVLAVEWVVVPTVSSTDVLTNKTIDADNNTLSNIEVDNFKWSAIVTESEGIASNDNDTSIPTSAAVKDYVDNNSWGATLWVWYALTGTFASTTTFTFSGDAWDAEAIERSLFTCLSTGWSTRRIGYVKSGKYSAWTVTVTVVTDSDLASWDNTFKVAINRKVEDYERLITIPWEQVADASNPQGMYYRSLLDTYLLPVNSFVRTAAAWAWAACAWNVYKWATNLFTSAQDMTTSATFDEKRPNTNTITAWDIITLRVTSSVWATNKASDLQVQLFVVPQTLFTTAD